MYEQENEVFTKRKPRIMPKYIKQEMPDLQQTGEQKIYYRLKTERHIDFKHFVQSLHQSNNGISEADIIRVLLASADHLAELVGEGHSVSLEGIGTFKATIGLTKEKELDTLDGKETKRNSRSLQLNGIHFRTDKKLIKKARPYCKLQREGTTRLHRSPFSKEERLQRALEFLNKHGAMRVPDYMELTGLSRTTATLELKEFRQDPDSGIDFIGRGSAKVYVKKG